MGKYDDISVLKSDIANWYNSDAYNVLSKSFQQTDFFKILGISRKENYHSKFIAWLLDPKSSHGLGDYPIKKFLQLLSISKNKYTNSDADFPDDFENNFILGNYSIDRNIVCDISTEYPIPPRKKQKADSSTANEDKKKGNDRIDIFVKDILITIEDTQSEFFILIENKVKSGEGDGQTQYYYDWAHGKITEKGNQPPKGIPLCVFLYPDILNTKCDCDKYIKITYQELVDRVIEPCLLKVSSELSRYYITEYLRTLSYSSEDAEGALVMAFSKEEKELCETFFEENKDLLTYVTSVLKSSDYDDDDFDSVSDYVKSQKGSSRDNTKYSFNGSGRFGKRRLALKIFQEASTTYKTFSEMKSIFSSLFEIFPTILVNDLSKVNDRNRYFVEVDEQINLTDGIYYLTNQWGKDVSGKGDGPFERMIKVAVDDLKFDIKEL